MALLPASSHAGAGSAAPDRATQKPRVLQAATPPAPSPAPKASPVPLGALARGRFLIASRQLTSPFFSETVVLLLEYGPTGAVGIIINRRTQIALTSLLPELTRLGKRKDRVFLGGPVETELVVFLIRSDVSPPESRTVIADVHATGSAKALRQVVAEGAPESRFHAYVGYAGWAPGQLDAEVAQGDWFVGEADPDQIFDDDLPELWQRLVQDHEGVQVRAPGQSTLARAD